MADVAEVRGRTRSRCGTRTANGLELVLSRLPEARPVGGSSQQAWRARCPAHADTQPSLSVCAGSEGRALIHCYAGCKPEAIVEALGLRLEDLMPDARQGMVRPCPAPTRPSGAGADVPGSTDPQRTFETAEQAIAELERRLGVCSKTWVYHDDYEDPVGYVLRWDRSGVAAEGPTQNKTIRPVSRRAQGWVLGGMAEPRPLYRLVELLKRPAERVYLTEGEKAADAAASLGLLATTSPHGSGSAHKAHWQPLAGREVVILPDQDDAGLRYAHDAAAILTALRPPAIVRIVPIPGLGPKEDICDWLEQRDAVESHTLRAQIEQWVEAAPLFGDRAPAGDRATRTEQPRSCVPGRVPVVTCLADVAPVAIKWLWPGRIALGRITMVVGRPGEGKSFLTIDMASRVSRGSPWPDGTSCPSGSVLLICAEDDPSDTIRPRLDAHGADVRRVHMMTVVRSTQADGSREERLFSLSDLESLETALKCYPDCRLVVVDPIGSFLGGCTDSHRDSDVRSVLAPVAKVAELYGPAVVVVAHRRKNTCGSADDLTMGSRAFTGIARAVWHVSRDTKNKARRLLLPGKNNLAVEGSGLAFTIESGPDTPAAIRWEREAVAMTADEALREETVATLEAGQRPEILRWLADLLADGPMPVEQLRTEAQNVGYAWRTVHRIKEDLGIRPLRQLGGRTWVWALPEKTGQLFAPDTGSEPEQAQPELSA